MRLSLMLPPQSAIALESSWTMPDAVAADRGNHDMLFHRRKFYRMSACQGVCPPLKVAIFPGGAHLMFSGSMVAIVTPMTADGGLDWPAWDRLLDFHVREGTDGIVVAGTTGESPALSAEEVEELTRRAVSRCRDKIKVIVGAGTHSTAGHGGANSGAVAAWRRCGAAGDAVLQQAHAGRAFTGTSRRPPTSPKCPVILYNVPAPHCGGSGAEHGRAAGATTRRSWRSRRRPDR